MDKTFDDLKRYAIKLDINKYEIGATILNLIAAHEQLQSKVSELSDKLYHESRRADEVAYVKDGEIKALQAKLDKACAALEFYAGSKDGEWISHVCDSYSGLNYAFDWNSDTQDEPNEVAAKALAEIRKKDE